MTAKFCEECGHALHEGAQFCGSCGHPVPGAATGAASEPPAAAPEPPVAEAPAPPAVPPAAMPTAASGGGGRNNLLLGLVALLVVAVAAVAVALFLGGGGDDKSASKQDREVLLESTASAGPAPFMPSLQPVSATVPTTVAPPATVPATTGRVAQGPFGGTGDNTLCDRELLVSFLTDPANSGIAREWARVLDIPVAQIPAYVRALIPTTLTGDTRVTNHTWQNGRAVGYQAVLERGTAVLVDTNGRLIARCRCGNPLLPPQEIAQPVYTGPKWEGFDPTVIVVVVPSPQPIYPPGGVGTLPQSTTPTTGKRPSTTTTTFRSEPDAAVARIRTSFEACARSGAFGITGALGSDEISQVLASAQYTATLTDQKTGTYRVVVVIPDQSVASGDIGGGTATWDVTLLTGEVTAVDENAQTTGTACPDLA
jgi:hypothetical protein